jgi:glutamine amidotransferase
MQLLASRGEEGGNSEGLGLIPGRVIPLKEKDASERIPHVGWNEVHPSSTSSKLLAGMLTGADFYFVHSYHFVADSASDVTASTPYCGGFSSVVEKGCIYGTQFHPEKSQRTGFNLIRNFLRV